MAGFLLAVSVSDFLYHEGRIIRNFFIMDINYWAVLLSAILAMVLGFLWYGPLFGATWARVVGATFEDKAAREAMQKAAMPLYVVQFLLVLFQIFILAYYVRTWAEMPGVANAFLIWAAFVMPTVAGASMWNNDSRSIAWTRFLLQAGYQLICFLLFGFVLSYWR